MLWKQPGTQEVIELLDRGMLDHSSKEFPLDLELEVNTGILLTYCLRIQQTLTNSKFCVPIAAE